MHVVQPPRLDDVPVEVGRGPGATDRPSTSRPRKAPAGAATCGPTNSTATPSTPWRWPPRCPRRSTRRTWARGLRPAWRHPCPGWRPSWRTRSCGEYVGAASRDRLRFAAAGRRGGDAPALWPGCGMEPRLRRRPAPHLVAGRRGGGARHRRVPGRRRLLGCARRLGRGALAGGSARSPATAVLQEASLPELVLGPQIPTNWASAGAPCGSAPSARPVGGGPLGHGGADRPGTFGQDVAPLVRLRGPAGHGEAHGERTRPPRSRRSSSGCP